MKSDYIIYGHGADAWGAFLGHNCIRVTQSGGHNREAMLSFKDARDIARRSLCCTSKDWKMWTRATGRPDGVPHDPQSMYPDEWEG